MWDQSRVLRRDNKLGERGISERRHKSGRWDGYQVRLAYKGKNTDFGTFKNLTAAIVARNLAKEFIKEYKCRHY